MARLVLGPEFTLKHLGYAILDAAAAKADGDADVVASLETEIRSMFEGAGNPDSIAFHYDNSQLVNIVIPDLEGKRIERISKNLDDFEISDIAAECMGSIVIRGCGK
ncbi:hypothetical protein [Phaeobacter inhibens]|uniref:hypothetical protein n=1 Tax=Phaeobacter inhibens TaxID=221822 RepID=UPI00076BB153|nr:hypothetical protein [Phaeobacter inhibens]KXF90891.1 hypothetical protein AT574_09875 [Phaeobacter inhibens]WHP67299.1 hypothetical protein QMZ01_12185 [Phaeobacter inhibens]